MISELYTAIAAALKTIPESEAEGAPALVKHIDLWNQNVEFIEEEAPWPRPAVFIEFGEFVWDPYTGPAGGLTAKPYVTLHVVTDWAGSTADGEATQAAAVAAMDLSEKISEVLYGLAGTTFRNLKLVSSQPNHNHEEVVESIERYSVTVERAL